MYMENNEVINRAYSLCSYFCLVSSEKMSSSEDYVKTLLIYWKESLFLSLLLLQTTMVFDIVLARIRRPQEKVKVERFIKYFKENFIPQLDKKTGHDLDELNRLALK